MAGEGQCGYQQETVMQEKESQMHKHTTIDSETHTTQH